MTIDLDRFEALARAATQGPWRKGLSGASIITEHHEQTGRPPYDTETLNFYGGHCISESSYPQDLEYILATQPAVVLQWIAETRIKDAELEAERANVESRDEQLDRWQVTIEQYGSERQGLLAKLRVAVEALVKADKLLREHMRECVNGGPDTCYICGESDKWTDQYEMTIRDATLSAPTGDKVK